MNKFLRIAVLALVFLPLVGFAQRVNQKIENLEVRNITPITGESAVNITNANIQGTSTQVTAVITGEAVIDSKYAAVGPDATTGLMIDVQSVTNGQTVVFTAVFGAAPKVIGNYSVDSGADAVIEFTSITPSNCVVAATAAKAISMVAIGARP